MRNAFYKIAGFLAACTLLSSCSGSKINLTEMGMQGMQLSYMPKAGSIARYQISSDSEFTQNMMGQEQSFGSTSDMLLAMTVTAVGESTIKYKLSYETADIENSVPGITDLDVYKKELLGSDISIESNPSGKVEKISGVDAIKKTTPGRNIELMLRNLFIVFPTKAIKIGDSWPEEETNIVVSGPLDIEIRSNTVYRFVGVEKYLNRDCYRFDSESKSTLSGDGEQGGMALEYEGTSVGQGVIYFDYLNGVIVSSSGSQTSEGIVSVPSQGMDIPTSSVQSAKIELVE